MLERREPAAQEAGAGGAGGWGGLPCSVRRGSAGKSFPEDAGQWRERKRRRQLHNIWQRRGPPGPRGSRAGGGRASATLPATPPLPDVHPAPPGPAPPPFLPAGTCPTPASSSAPAPGAPRTPRSPQRPGDTRPRHLWHPHPLMAFPAPAGRPGGTLSACPQMGRAPLRGTVVPLPRPSPAVQQLRPQQSRAGGAGPPHPCRRFPPHPSCPESLWMQTVRARELPIARPRQIAG